VGIGGRGCDSRRSLRRPMGSRIAGFRSRHRSPRGARGSRM